ncbi:MAG: DedA family protein [Actinobacteria bacterium]|nr:MAG: DedA family protein [Actinomycetota bacterium]
MLLALLQNLVDLLTGSVWTYPILFGICLGDAVIPALPSETAVIVCGIQAARGQLSLGWVIAFAALGAFLGDNASYSAGHWLGRPVVKRFFSGEVAQGRLDWAERFLQQRGSYVLVVARFVPGGRTATTFTAGLVHLRWRTRFMPYIFVAAILWSCYGALLGYLGGRTFRDQPIYALLLALGIAAAITVGVEVLRRVRK